MGGFIMTITEGILVLILGAAGMVFQMVFPIFAIIGMAAMLIFSGIEKLFNVLKRELEDESWM